MARAHERLTHAALKAVVRDSFRDLPIERAEDKGTRTPLSAKC